MFGRSSGILTAACALGASALLIPPGVAPAAHHEAAFPVVVDPTSQFFTLPCPGCVFSSKQEKTDDLSDDLFWIQGGANSLLFKFSVSEDGHRLQLGGQDLYRAADLPTERLNVQQIPSAASIAELEAGEVNAALLAITSLDVIARQQRATSDGEDARITWTDISIKGLEGQQMDLDTVTVTTLQLVDGQILILNVEPRPTRGHGLEMMPVDDEDSPHFHQHRPEPVDGMTPPHHGRPHGVARPGKIIHKECSNLPAPLCRFKHAFESKVFGMGKPGRKPCPGRKGQHLNPWKGKDGRVRLPSHIKGPKFPSIMDGRLDGPHHGRLHHGRPHHMHSHHDDHHRHHQHSFLHAFVNGLVAVLVPAMAGIIIGTAVSFIGVTVGCLIRFLWIKFVRGGRRGYASVALDETTAEALEYKNADVAEMEAPPMYEPAPRYEDEVREEK